MPTESRDVLRVRTTATAGALCVILSALTAAQAGDAGVESIRADALKGHVYFLSAPEMGGRDSLSLEGRIAANYIAGFFYRLGLKTVGEGGSYFQPFPMSEAAIDRAQTRLRATITAKSGGTTERNYVLGSDFTLARQGGTDVDVTAPLVFAGYGIDAPEYGYNDYAGLDVAGKIVLVLSREPQAADPQSRFLGTWDTFHAYPSWKPEVARHRGAAGVLIVQGPPRRPQRVASGPTNGQVRTDRPNHSLTSPFWDLPVFTIDARVADDLLAGSGKTIADLQSSVDKAGRPQSFEVPDVKVQMRRAVSERRTVQTRNVVGVIEGSDPKLKDEYVLVTGHYDHVGQKPPLVFHGADDNASATAAVIAIAEAFKTTPAEAQRDVPGLRGRGRLPPGRVLLRRSPDRAARPHRRGAEHGHDRPRRRVAHLEHQGRRQPQRRQRGRHALQPGSPRGDRAPEQVDRPEVSTTRPTTTIAKGGSSAAITFRLRSRAYPWCCSTPVRTPTITPPTTPGTGSTTPRWRRSRAWST